MYYNCGIAIAKKCKQSKTPILSLNMFALVGLQKLIMVSIDFPPFFVTTLQFSDFSRFTR